MSTMNYLSYLVLYRICGCVLCLIQMCMCFSFEAVFKKPGHCLFFFFEWSFFLRIYYLLFGKKLCQNHEILLLIPTFFFNNTHRLPKVERGEKETFWKPVIFWRSVKKLHFFLLSMKNDREILYFRNVTVLSRCNMKTTSHIFSSQLQKSLAD